MKRFVIELTGTTRNAYVERIAVNRFGYFTLNYTLDIEKAALFTEEAAALFVFEAENNGLAFWSSPVDINSYSNPYSTVGKQC